MKKILFIVGNGFDLAHGIPSKYKDFKIFCKKSYQNLYTQIEECLPRVSEDWSNFEDALGHQKFSVLKEHIKRNQQIGRDYPVGIDYSELKYAFRDWIVSVNEKIRALISEGEIKRKENIEPNSFFLSFNYTNTLEKVYNVQTSRICYIHGREPQDDFNKKDEEPFLSLIYGHNKDKKDFEFPATVTDDERQEFQSAIMTFNKDFQYGKLKEWIQRIGSITHIVALGHSMSEIDFEYFEIIRHAYPNVYWEIGYFNEPDLKHKIRVCNRLGITSPSFFEFK